MRLPFDPKAIAYGLGVYVLGYLALTIPTTLAANMPTFSTFAWPLIQVAALFMPALGGCVGALKAPARSIAHGTVAGTLGVLLLIVAAVTVAPSFSPVLVVGFVVVSALLASLGAIIGNHVRSRRGT